MLMLLLLLMLMMMGMSLLMMRILFLKLMLRMPVDITMMFRYGLVASLVIPVHLLPLITLLPSIIFILLSALLPESPVWLMRFVHPDDDLANECFSYVFLRSYKHIINQLLHMTKARAGG